MASVVMADDGVAFDGAMAEAGPLGGAETAFVALAEALAARGHDVRAFSRCAAPLRHKGVVWSPIASGDVPISYGVAQLRSAAQRGKNLPPLSPPERQALVRQTGPALLQAVDRVLGELRRLQATPGLRSDFERLIAAYTRTREEIQSELDQP